jgi:hypothetical protein
MATTTPTAKSSPSVTIDGVKYDVASLSKEARNALNNLGATEAELKHLQVQVGIARVARQVFAQQLKATLPKAG